MDNFIYDEFITDFLVLFFKFKFSNKWFIIPSKKEFLFLFKGIFKQPKGVVFSTTSVAVCDRDII